MCQVLGIKEYNGDHKTNMKLTLTEIKVQYEKQTLTHR